jgi:hypothetical protein
VLLLLLLAEASGAGPAAATALSTAVAAHRLLVAQEGRLGLLVQQLADKEELLQRARQLVRPTRGGGGGGDSPCVHGLRRRPLNPVPP